MLIHLAKYIIFISIEEKILLLRKNLIKQFGY